MARDSTTTNVYHTGLILSDADKRELEMDRLEQIEEDGIQEEEDEEDPDEDLDFWMVMKSKIVNVWWGRAWSRCKKWLVAL